MSIPALALTIAALLVCIIAALVYTIVADMRADARAAAERAQIDADIAAAKRLDAEIAAAGCACCCGYEPATRRRKWRDAPGRRADALELVQRAEGGHGAVSILALTDERAP